MNSTYDHRKSAGLCVDCGEPREPQRMTKVRCAACARKRILYQRQWARGQHRKKQAVPPGSYAARIPCYRCWKPFASSDRRSVRHCDPCRKKVNGEWDNVGSIWA